MIDELVLDMDGVLVQQVRGACQFHNAPWPYVEGEQAPWRLAPLLGLSEKECWEPLGFDYWRNLEPFPHMQELVALLESYFGAEKICILSAPIKTHGCIDGKREWIEEHLPKYKNRCMFGWSKQFCAAPNRALIDDKTENVELFREGRGEALLFPAPWNARFAENGLDAVKTWLEALDTRVTSLS